jgi:hypothetical protein
VGWRSARAATSNGGAYEWAGEVEMHKLDGDAANTDLNKAAMGRELIDGFSCDADPWA